MLFPPVLPALDIHRDPERKVAPPGTPLKLVYTGKFAPRWNTLEMTSLPALLASRGVDAEVHMVGDKGIVALLEKTKKYKIEQVTVTAPAKEKDKEPAPTGAK